MITIEQLIPGNEIIVNDTTTTILTGHYDDPELGLMIKTSKYPGGFPAAKHALPGQQVETVPAVIFEVAIIDKEDPVKITAALIREKAKPLMALTIDSIFDEDGYEKVKKAKTKAVKMRTAIKAKEDEVLKTIKTRHGEEIKVVTDYTAELYTACLEAQNDLQGKLDKIDKERKEASDKLAEEKKAKTDGRNAKMYELGMMFNGTAFFNFGKNIPQDVLHAMADDKYAELLVEIEGLSMEQGVTGTAPLTVPPIEPKAPVKSFGGGWGSPSPKVYETPVMEAATKPEYPNTIYSKEINGMVFYLTKGKITTTGAEVVTNERVADSGVYVQIVKL